MKLVDDGADGVRREEGRERVERAADRGRRQRGRPGEAKVKAGPLLMARAAVRLDWLPIKAKCTLSACALLRGRAAVRRRRRPHRRKGSATVWKAPAWRIRAPG